MGSLRLINFEVSMVVYMTFVLQFVQLHVLSLSRSVQVLNVITKWNFEFHMVFVNQVLN